MKLLFLDQGKVGAISSGHARSDAAPYRARRARYRLFDRRRRSRDAVGVRLGARAVRDLGCDRRARGARCDARRRPAPSTSRRRSRRFSMPAAIDSGSDGVPPAAPDLQILKAAKDREPRRSAQCRRQPRRSRRRRARRRVPFEDEHDRRRHRADAPCRREGSHARISPRWSSATTRRISRPAPT